MRRGKPRKGGAPSLAAEVSGPEAELGEVELQQLKGVRRALASEFDRTQQEVVRLLEELKETTLGAAETALGEASASFRALVEQVPAIAYIDAVDKASSTIYISPQVEPLLGYSPREWKADPDLWPKLLHPEDRHWVLEEHYRTNATGDPFRDEYRLIARDGRVVWVRDEAVLKHDERGRPRFWVGVMVDITEHKQAEELLEQAEAKYRTLVEQVPAIVYTAGIGERGRWFYVSPQIEALLGFSPAEWQADPELWARRLHPDDRERVLEEEERAKAPDQPQEPSEYRLIARDGTVVWVHDAAVVVRDAAGQPLFWQGVILDITSRKEAEEGTEPGGTEIGHR